MSIVLIGTHFEARVTRIADGDTVELIPVGQTRPIRIRFEGVDAPELGEVFSRESIAFVRTLLLDQRVGVDGHDVDRYGRLVARVSAGGKDASLELIKAGLACHRFAPDAALPRRKRGEDRRGRVLGGRSQPSRNASRLLRAPGALRRRRVQVTPPANGLRSACAGAGVTLHGNVSTHLYHTATCPNFNCRNCTRVFTSEADAQAAGFTPAGDC